MGRWIDYAHGEAKLRGWFAPGEGGGPRPGVLITHAWLGITDSIRGRADRIAAMGYSAFALDVFGRPVDEAGGPFPMIKPFLDDRRLFRDRLRAGLETDPQIRSGQFWHFRRKRRLKNLIETVKRVARRHCMSLQPAYYVLTGAARA